MSTGRPNGMLFNSLQYFGFFLVVGAVYFLLPLRFRWAWLLAASCYFYMAWKPVYILLLAASTLVGYLTANAIGRTEEASRRRLFLWISVGSNLGFLFVFKYFNFLNRSVAGVLSWF